MRLSTDDLCRLAADLAREHGDGAIDLAHRAVLTFEAEGAIERAHLWFTLSVLLDDIAAHRLDPLLPQTLH